MPPLRASDRLRRVLQRFIGPGKPQKAVDLVRFSETRPGGAKIKPQNISYFLNNAPGRPHPLAFDDLDDIAAFCRLTIGDLFESPRPGELSSDEQRLVYAFRALADPQRDQFLGLLEAASIGAPRQLGSRSRYLKPRAAQAQTQPHAGSLPSDIGTQIIDIQASLDRLLLDIGTPDRDTGPDRQVSGTGPDESADR